MPIATPDPATGTAPWNPVSCAHCGTPLFQKWTPNTYPDGKPTLHHFYPGQFEGQMICDPQQARAAKQERQAHA